MYMHLQIYEFMSYSSFFHVFGQRDWEMFSSVSTLWSELTRNLIENSGYSSNKGKVSGPGNKSEGSLTINLAREEWQCKMTKNCFKFHQIGKTFLIIASGNKTVLLGELGEERLWFSSQWAAPQISWYLSFNVKCATRLIHIPTPSVPTKSLRVKMLKTMIEYALFTHGATASQTPGLSETDWVCMSDWECILLQFCDHFSSVDGQGLPVCGCKHSHLHEFVR